MRSWSRGCERHQRGARSSGGGLLIARRRPAGDRRVGRPDQRDCRSRVGSGFEIAAYERHRCLRALRGSRRVRPLGLAAADLDAYGAVPAARCSRSPRFPARSLPQTRVDARAVEAYFGSTTPSSRRGSTRLGLFNVYTSVWFSAVYLLLMVSLVGCIVPADVVYCEGVRAPVRRKAPANFGRMPASVVRDVEALDVDAAVAAGRAGAARPGARRRRRAGRSDRVVAERATCARPATCCSTSAVVGVLVGVAVGSLFGYRGVGDRHRGRRLLQRR